MWSKIVWACWADWLSCLIWVSTSVSVNLDQGFDSRQRVFILLLLTTLLASSLRSASQSVVIMLYKEREAQRCTTSQ